MGPTVSHRRGVAVHAMCLLRPGLGTTVIQRNPAGNDTGNPEIFPEDRLPLQVISRPKGFAASKGSCRTRQHEPVKEGFLDLLKPAQPICANN